MGEATEGEPVAGDSPGAAAGHLIGIGGKNEPAPELVVPPAALVDALSCPICLGLLKDPLITACCHNNFCRHCLKSSLLAKPECPLCRAPLALANTLPNRAIRNLLPAGAHESGRDFQALFDDGRRHATRLLSCLLLAIGVAACLSVALPSAKSPCKFVSATLPGGSFFLACRTPEPMESAARGGNPLLEPLPDWGRVAAAADRESTPASRLRTRAPVLAEDAADGDDASDGAP